MAGVTCTVAIAQNPGIKCVVYIEEDARGRNTWKRRPFPQGGLLKLPVSSGVWDWSASGILWLQDREKNPKFSLMLFDVPAGFLYEVTFQSIEGVARAAKYKPMIYEMQTGSPYA